MPEKSTPILISGSQFTYRPKEPDASLTPLKMLEQAARQALNGTGASESVREKIDAIGIVAPTHEAPNLTSRFPQVFMRNVPHALGKQLGITPSTQVNTATGGNSPQMLVNNFAERIAEGEVGVALLAGTECLGNLMKVLGQGDDVSHWGGDEGPEVETLGTNKEGVTEQEDAHGLSRPVNGYPLFENALRGKYNLTIEQHQKKLGELFSPFSRVASENPNAWFPTYRTPEEISQPSDANRMVGFPYTKYLNAIIQINMSSALVMMSVGAAEELGIDPKKWVFLHGCADANDLWYVSERQNFYSSPAIRIMGQQALDMAGKTIADIDHIDLYSCFPSAVEVACDELGIAHDDPRGLTVTGGLPYFGGPGNNYVMHSIVTATEKARQNPGSYALTTANGWYLTKHSAGIYSTEAFAGQWKRVSPSTYQKEIDVLPHPKLVLEPNGPAEVETYTIISKREGPFMGIVFGRTEDGSRFIANLPADQKLFAEWMAEEKLGSKGTATSEQGGMKNTFVPN